MKAKFNYPKFFSIRRGKNFFKEFSEILPNIFILSNVSIYELEFSEIKDSPKMKRSFANFFRRKKVYVPYKRIPSRSIESFCKVN